MHWKRHCPLGQRRKGKGMSLPIADSSDGTTSSRFPVISGFRVSWDSRRPPGQRVLGIWLSKEAENSEHGHDAGSGVSTPRLVDAEPIQRTHGGKKYNIVTREYMAQGHDGFESLKGQRYLIDDENGQLMSAIVRKYLLGKVYTKSQFGYAELFRERLPLRQ